MTAAASSPIAFDQQGFTHGAPAVSYYLAGASGPRVLLIMGLGMRGEIWRPQIERLRATHQVAWFDHAGVGDSERRAFPFRIRDMAGDAVTVLDALGWRTAHVVGVSMGGMVAQELVLTAPHRAESLTLLATFGGGALRDKFPPGDGVLLMAQAIFGGLATRTHATQRLLYTEEFLRTADPALLASRLGAQLARPVPRPVVLGQVQAALRHNALPRLTNLSVPTLVIKPERDVLVRPRHADAIAARIPNARLVTLPDVGHGLLFERANEVSDLVAGHVARVESTRAAAPAAAPTALANPAPWPARGSYADGFEPVARRFARHLATGQEIGAGFTVFHRGKLVVDLAGGVADTATGRPFDHDTRIVVFSVTKGFAAMALSLLADRGKLDWDAPIAEVWPQFAQAGKGHITARQLFGHRAGLAWLDTQLSLADCIERPDLVRAALEAQRPAADFPQGYHAVTFGLFAREVFERIAGEPLGPFLRRELFEPLGSDVYLGSPAALDDRVATLYPPSNAHRVFFALRAVLHADSPEGRIARGIVHRDSPTRRAFSTPTFGPRGVLDYKDIPVRRATLAWCSANASAHGVARAYLPFSQGGAHDGRRYFAESTVAALAARDGWSERDLVLSKPLGWNRGFLKEEVGVFGPAESFGHSGMGGALGWCDPISGLAVGYVLNKLDDRVRSPRAMALMQALYACPAVVESRLG
ncbi:MAG: alpha/beta fold hydrolase [Polyangiaceae bacterium]